MATVTCPVSGCNYKTTRNASLRHHLVQHDAVAIKQNTCILCNVQTVNAKQNRKHYIAFHGCVDDVACPGCDEVFKYPKDLKQHLQQCTEAQLSPSQIQNLVNKLPPVNVGDGVPDPSRFQRESVVRRRGKYKTAKSEKRTAPLQRSLPTPAKIVAIATKKPLTAKRRRHCRHQIPRLQIHTRRFLKPEPAAPLPSLILDPNFNSLPLPQFKDEEEEEEDEEIESLTILYSPSTDPLPVFEDIAFQSSGNIKICDDSLEMETQSLFLHNMEFPFGGDDDLTDISIPSIAISSIQSLFPAIDDDIDESPWTIISETVST